MSRMKPFRSLVSHSEALESILSTVRIIERTEVVPIDSAVDRVLAEDVIADMNVPPFSRAAMDGYAVLAEDTFKATSLAPVRLRLVGVIHTGELSDKKVSDGECVQIATGCPIPDGANAVVMVEFTEAVGNEIAISRPVYPGANIAPEGEDLKKGESSLRAGELLAPGKIGILAALGRTHVKVLAQPTVAVLPTGKEVGPVGSSLEKGQVYDINSHTLISIINTNGGRAVQLPIASDSLDDLAKTITRGSEADLIVVSGGSSVGQRDLLVDTVETLGKILFHGVQVSPGKPTLFGIIQGKPIFGMPGYPTSCLSNAYLFLVPALRKMANLPPKKTIEVRAKMAQRVVSTLGRKEFLTVTLKDGEAYPLFKKSGAITAMAKADGYVVIPENLDVLEKGDEVIVTLL